MDKNYKSVRDKLFEDIKNSYSNSSKNFDDSNNQYKKRQNINKTVLISAFVITSLVAAYAIYNYSVKSQEHKHSTKDPSLLELRVGE